MEERDWQIIKSLYEHRNITKTARSLYISQPALTARIKLIEENLKTKIINRGNKGISFTPAGEFVANYAHQISLSLRNFREDLANIEGEMRGVLRIAAPNFVNYRLSRLLGKFKNMYPHVEYNIFTAQSSDVIAGMKAQEYHFGLVLNDFDWHENEKFLVAKDSLCIASKEPFTLEDLPKMVRVDYIMDGYHRHFLDKWWESRFKIPPKTGIWVSSLDVCKEMIMSGLGYAIVPSMVIEEQEKLHKIKVRDNDGNLVLRQTWFLYRKQMLDLKLGRAFIEFIRQAKFTKEKL